MLIAGVDEVGRGPLAGPVVTAAVVLPQEFNLPGLTDSKRVTPKRRATLAQEIKAQAIAWSLGQANIEEIDSLNILQATMLAMQRAVAALDASVGMILVDGNRCPEFAVPSRAIIGGDGLEPCISAASIIAKVARDTLMTEYAVKYPQYGFDKNSGYPTKQHREALVDHGITPIHRLSFAPVKALL